MFNIYEGARQSTHRRHTGNGNAELGVRRILNRKLSVARCHLSGFAAGPALLNLNSLWQSMLVTPLTNLKALDLLRAVESVPARLLSKLLLRKKVIQQQ